MTQYPGEVHLVWHIEFSLRNVLLEVLKFSFYFGLKQAKLLISQIFVERDQSDIKKCDVFAVFKTMAVYKQATL